MARYYTEEGITKIAEAYAGLRGRCVNLQQRFIEYKFMNAKAREFALHGLSRRLGVLIRCIDNTFRIIPPQMEEVPTSDATQDATIQLQAFIINVSGCLDNLAWIWVVERNILKANGARLSPKEIGLRTPNVSVRESLPDGFREYLESIADWFAYLESYRHALAHQIPLYIPPYAIDPRNEADTMRSRRRSRRALCGAS